MKKKLLPSGMQQPILSPAELAVAFRDHLHSVLSFRLGYYLMRIPTDQDLARIRIEDSDDGKHVRYYHGTECLMHVDMSDTSHVRIAGWDIITEAEVNGSAPGSPSFPAGADTSILQEVGKPSEFILKYAPPGKSSR